MKNKTYLLCFCLFTFFFQSSSYGQKRPDFLENNNNEWVEKTFSTLTLDEKIGQLLLPRGNFSGKGYQPEKLMQWVKEYKIGGVVFFAGQPTIQAKITNDLQAASKVPLLIGQDFEWGLAMRLDSTVRFPYAMALGAMQGNELLIEKMGEEIGKQCKRIGVHVNYAPVVDVNVNPNNPVINFRSFGEDKNQVAKKALAYMKGLQNQHVLATAKHFPGHGDTGVDSHYDLPVIQHPTERLHAIELYPYKELINNGLSGIMTAHLSVPALDSTPNLAATLSPKIITDLLRKDLRFEGLVFTDAMDMQGAVKHFPNGQALVKAILAGNDILETFLDVPTAVNAIREAVLKGELPMEVLDARVKKILRAKAWVGLDKYQPVSLTNLVEDLNPTTSDLLNRQFAEASLTLVKNENLLYPIQDLTKKIAIVSVESNEKTAFQHMADNYTTVQHFQVPTKKANDTTIQQLAETLRDFDMIVVALHLPSVTPYAKYGISESTQKAMKLLSSSKNAILVIFGNPYSLGKLEEIESASSILVANQLTKYTEEAAAQALFGAIATKGKLPVTVNEIYRLNTSIVTQPLGRLAYGIPEQVGVNGSLLQTRIDSVISLGMNEKAYPGAVIQIAKDGRVIYKKAYGFHTFEDAQNCDNESIKIEFEKGNKDVMDAGKKKVEDHDEGFVQKNEALQQQKGKVQLSDIYDLASVTKVTTSALAIMQLMSENKFDLDKNFADYYPGFRNTNKANLTFRDMLTHRSGLKAWIPFWMDCIDSTATLKNAISRNKISENECVKIDKKRTFWQKIIGKKATQTIDFMATASNKSLWLKALSSETITWKKEIFSSKKTEIYSVQVADTLWLHKDYHKTIFKQIETSAVKPQQGYVYSDLHYYTYPLFMPLITGMDWESYLKKTYQQIGANSLTYNPLRYFSKEQIVPTERDTLFRKTQIHGRVHDEGAALLNGISGHAGLFGNANDLTKLMQLYLQKGSYGSTQFIKPEVVNECTRYQFESEGNRRAIAFDKLDFNKKISNGPQLASPESYGHSGYTGTFTWVDPATNSVYVFLSNRVYPTRDNNKISTLNIRTEVGNQLYKTIQETKD
jgi:beta-N-acetylhexosaminidase